MELWQWRIVLEIIGTIAIAQGFAILILRNELKKIKRKMRERPLPF